MNLLLFQLLLLFSFFFFFFNIVVLSRGRFELVVLFFDKVLLRNRYWHLELALQIVLYIALFERFNCISAVVIRSNGRTDSFHGQFVRRRSDLLVLLMMLLLVVLGNTAVEIASLL